jgi:hypothetical protein
VGRGRGACHLLSQSNTTTTTTNNNNNTGAHRLR